MKWNQLFKVIDIAALVAIGIISVAAAAPISILFASAVNVEAVVILAVSLFFSWLLLSK